jgi:preprotein translocase subunit YajC
MEITVSKSIKVVPIVDLDQVYPGLDIYTTSGIHGVVTYIDSVKFDVYFAEKDKTLSFINTGPMANLMWGIFKEVPDYDKVVNNALNAAPVAIDNSGLESFKQLDEVVLYDDVYGYVESVKGDSVKIMIDTGNSYASMYINKDTPKEVLENIKVLKLH